MSGELSRRRFLRKAAAIGTGAAISPLASRVLGGPLIPRHVPSIDLAIARGDSPARNCLAAVETLGGFRRFVRKGDRVVIKPNPVGTSAPEHAINTHPEMVGTVVRSCLEAGAREVLVVSNDEMRGFQGNGIAAAVERAGGSIRILQDREAYRTVVIPRGRVLQTVEIATDVLDSDLFINMPIAKHHAGTRVTLSMKNLMGTIWDRFYFHQTDLQQCIAELSTVVRQDLIIMDANHVLLTNGPVGPGEVLRARTVIAGWDPVAVDAFATTFFKIGPARIPHIRAAWQIGAGEIDIGRLRVRDFEA